MMRNSSFKNGQVRRATNAGIAMAWILIGTGCREGATTSTSSSASDDAAMVANLPIAKPAADRSVPKSTLDQLPPVGHKAPQTDPYSDELVEIDGPIPVPGRSAKDVEVAKLVRAGVQSGELGNVDGAIDRFKTALTIDPESPDAHAQLGAALGIKGDRAGALHHLREACRISPTYAPAWGNLAYALLEEGTSDEFPEGLEAARKAVELEPELDPSRYLLATALDRAGLSAEAVEHFALLVGRHPDDVPTRLRYGIALRRAGKLTEAVGVFNELLGQNDDLVFGYIGLSETYLEMGDLKGAVDTGAKAVELDRYSADAHAALAHAHLESGDAEKALASARDAARQDVADARAHYLMGRAYLKLERRNEAYEEYEYLRRINRPLAAALVGLLKPESSAIQPPGEKSGSAQDEGVTGGSDASADHKAGDDAREKGAAPKDATGIRGDKPVPGPKFRR